MDHAAAPDADYGADYYASHCGTVPYVRNDHWLHFFGQVADRLVAAFDPTTVYDAGCALGFLVESLWDRGVETWGRDISRFAISEARPDIRGFLDVGSIADAPPGPGRFDLVTCIEVVEHMDEAEALRALDILTAAAPRILFSSSPTDFVEPTHINVRPTLYWLRAFAARGFSPDWTHNALYLAPHAMVLERGERPPGDGELRLYAEWIRTRSALVEREQRIGRLQHAEKERDQARAGLAEAEARLEAAKREMDGLLRAERARAVMLKARAAEQETIAADALRREAETTQDAARAAHEAAADRFALDRRLAVTEEMLTALRRQAAERAEELHRQSEALHGETQALAAARAVAERLPWTEKRLHAAESALAELRTHAGGLETQARVIQSSTIWRATGPLRRALGPDSAVRPAVHAAAQAGKWVLVWRIPRRLRVRRAHAAMAAALRASGTFDAGAYLAANEDVAAAGLDPALHYVRFGQAEGRPLCPVEAPPPALPMALPVPGATVAPRPPAPPAPSYAEWLRGRELTPGALDLQRRLAAELPRQPLLSVLTPVYRVASDVLDDTIRSVVAQTYPNWELCLAVGDTSDAANMEVMRAWAARDRRVQVKVLTENRGISGNSDAALAMATGEWCLLLDHDDLLSPDALFEMVRASQAHPDATFLYSDKDQVGPDGVTRMHPLLKGAWSPDTMLNANYLTHLNMIRTARLRAIGGWDAETDGAQDWDLFLRAIGSDGPGEHVRHVPRVLYHWRQVPTSVAVGGYDAKPYAANGQLRTIDRYLQTAGWPGAEVRQDGPNLRVTWPANFLPRVSILRLGSADWRLPEWAGGIELLSADTSDPAGALDDMVARATGEVLVVWDSRLRAPTDEVIAELVGPLANERIALVAGQVRGRDGRIEAFGAVVADGAVLPGFRGMWPEQGGECGFAGWYGNASLAPLRAAALRRADWSPLAAIGGTVRPDLCFTLTLPVEKGRILRNPYAVAHAEAADPFPPLPPDDPLRAAVGTVLPDGDPFVSPHLVPAGEAGFLRLRMPDAVPAPRPHDYAAEAGYCAGAYDVDRAAVSASIAGCAAAAPGKLRSLCWIVPDFDVAFYGGVHTILRAADHMRRTSGVRPSFAILGGAPLETMRERIGQAFPELAAAATLLRASAEGVACGPVDALVSTLWTTSYAALRTSGARRKFQFLQDWEPLFYPAGTLSGLVEATYRFGFHGVCNTVSLAESYRELGGSADWFAPSVDRAVFRPRRAPRPDGAPFRLFCYARPTTPRNAFPTLAAAMRTLKARHGEAIDIVTAGAAWSPADAGLEGVVRHLGLLPYAETGMLYRACDAGLVAMATRHPSYLPFELMACGGAVVTNRNPHTEWLLRDGETASVFEMTASDVVRAVEAVMTDSALRERLVANGYGLIERDHGDWDRTCRDIHGIFARVCEAPAG